MRREAAHSGEDATGRMAENAGAMLALTKPGLTAMSAGTAVGGFFLASEGSPAIAGLVATLVGTFLVGGAAGTLNQFLEHEYDARMKRTERRPIPAGKVAPSVALLFGVLSGSLGLLVLAAWTTGLAAVLAGLTLLTYLGLYTPLKRRTHLATAVGGIPGALPPVIGWTAVTGDVGLGAYLLFLLLFLWQMPHFLALAWMYRVDYKRAGYRLLPALDPSGGVTSRVVLLYIIILIPATAALTLAGVTGVLFTLLMLPSAVWFLLAGARFIRETGNAQARRVFLASLAYIPSVFLGVILDRLFL